MSQMLTKSEAKAVADAFCALNNVCGIVEKIDFGRFEVRTESELIVVDGKYDREVYKSQAEFFDAYGVA